MDQDQALSQDFTFFSLLKYAAPSIFVFVFIAVYQIVDGIFIERFEGDLAISAVNLYYPIICMFLASGIMLGTGGNAMIVKLVGEGKKKEAGQTFSRLLLFTLIIGVILTAVFLIFGEPIMRLCGATDGNIGYFRPYYRVLTSAAIPIILQSELGLLIIGEGKTVTAAIVIMIGGVLNCVLDFVFMKYLHWGIKGAAIATAIGYVTTIVYAVWFYLIAKKSSYTIELAKPGLKEIGKICFNGSSEMVSNLSEGVTVLFMNHLAFRCYGETGVSAVSVYTYVQYLIVAVFMGYAAAVEPIFSYHYGSGNVEARKKVFKMSMWWQLILGGIYVVVLFFLRSQVVGIFFDKGTDFFRISLTGYYWALPACLFVGINTFASGLFTAFSNGLVSAILSVLRTFVFITACMFAMTAIFGGPGLWSAWPTAEILSLFVSLIAFKMFRKRYEYL